jgi:hypothetical protein
MINNKLKHSKYKNTGFIFELLTRQIATDVLTAGQTPSLALIKKYFKEVDIAEIFLVSNPGLLSLGDTVLVGALKHDKKYSTSKCGEGVLGVFYSPTSSFTDSSTNISLAKTVQGTDLVYFEICNTKGKFFMRIDF